ncbi:MULTISPECIES: LysR substrate-binding domain-containing protein [Arcobacteraceae]|uniref:LysR substrate-binding domain-containing protein n=1 Tax=Arcobacteraceae TaxID=2808963 RepID=UPI000DEBD301|nr:LysR substrate-binding domain-containing protein [Arcobacter sp. CECT 9188]RBQ26388.1 LysR family transcriptional regulator [Arcobacter sp. CECT 9188]
MTLKELNFFYKLSENPQVTQVANELNISQSAISLAIKSLENSLNEQLFDRVGKKLILNEKGRYFKEKTFFHYLTLIDAQNIFQKNKLAGNIKIASSKTISNYIMPNIYFDFISKYKDVKLDILNINSTEIIDKISKGTLDIGLIEVDTQNNSLVKEKLADDELIVVTSDEQQEKLVFIDSIKKKWILRESGSGTREIFMDHIGEISKELNIFMELQDFEEIKTIILNNKNTVTALSKVIVQKEIETKKLYKIDLKNLKLRREFYLIYNKEKAKNLLFDTFKEFIKNRFKDKILL